MARRPSPQSVVVLLAFAADPTVWRYGYELGQEVGLKAGSLYPILMRLCDRGQLEATWQSDIQGRPPRHLYRLSEHGQRVAAELGGQAGVRVAREGARTSTVRAGAPTRLRPRGATGSSS